jgi:hypothetical protein
MEDLIELYLFKNKRCPLPALGVLEINDANAVAQYREGKIEAPLPSIKLLDATMPVDDFIKFIASNKNISIEEANNLLTGYCRKLQNMDAYGETKLPHAGKFYVNADGNLVFKTIDLPRIFSPDLVAERIIHPSVAHTMVVGDKETTTTEMAAYYSETDAPAKDRWWIWALAVIVIAGALVLLHLNDNGTANPAGNSSPIEIKQASPTYRIAG